MVDEPIDIGIAGADASPIDAPQSPPGRPTGSPRRLSLWAVVPLTLLVGWFFGALFSGGGEAAVELADPMASEADPTAPPRPDEPPTTTATATGEPPPPTANPEMGLPTAVLVVQAPVRGIAIPAEVQLLQNGTTRRITVDNEISASSLEGFGYGQRRILTVGDSAVFMARESVMLVDETLTESIELAEAIYLLPGSSAEQVWAVTAGTRSVLDIDVAGRRVRGEYPLEAVGTPLASFAGGLVISPADSELGSIATWNPRRGVEPLFLAPEITFIDAAANTLAVHTPEGLAALDVVTGGLTQSDRTLSASEQYRSSISPDGTLIALVERRPIGEFPQVQVIDIATGNEVDRFDTAYEWQMKWTARGEILHLAFEDPWINVMLRSVDDRTSRRVAELSAPNFWVTLLDR